VPDLLEQTKSQSEEHAEALRARIQELHDGLGIRFPVYVLVTKADLLAGFMEFFGEHGREERAQVWGVSFPIAEKSAAQLPGLQDELALLETRLNERLVERLQQERDVSKRALIYNFPQQFSAFRKLLADFLEQVFDPSTFETQPLVRGVYFTSGTQEGSPIDRIMGQLSRAFGLEQRVLPPSRASGKAYFITRLIRDVMLAESGLAGTNLRWERRRAFLQWGVLCATLLVAVGVISLWMISYARNQAYVADVDANLQAVSRQVGELKVRPNADVVALLPVLRQVKGLADTADVAVNDAPMSMSFGLYQGRKLGSAANAAYRRVLQDAFLPRIQARMEQQMRARGAQNPEFLYESLKAYVMLGDAQHFDADALKTFIVADWEFTLPRDVTVEQRKELAAHLDALFAQGYVTSPIPQDAHLIASARDTLSRTPIPQRIYNRLRRQGVGNDLTEFSVARVAGPATMNVFTRESGEPITKGVPGLYSYDGYYKTFIPQAELVTQQLAGEEDWVLGVPAGERGRLGDATARLRLSTEVRRLFLEDYARTWDQFVKDLKIVRPASLQESINVARILSAPDSPLPTVLRAIVKEVTLVRTDPAEKDIVEKTTDVIAKKRDELRKIMGQQAPAVLAPSGPRVESIVDDRFENLRRLTRSLAPGQPAPIDNTVALIGQLYALLTANDVALRNASPAPQSDLPVRIKVEAGQLPEPLRSMLLNLSQSAANQSLTASRENISKALPTGIGNFCDQAIAGRYPFSRNSSRDVTQDDFAKLFAPGGIIDDFFQKNLAQQVDTSARPWKFRQVGDTTVTTSSAALLQFERAQTIRDVFFRSGRAPGFRIDFKPLEMDPTITQFILDVDGQVVKYSHEPPQRTPVLWPAPNGSNQVRVQLSPTVQGAASAQSFDGPWALFRMFDKMRFDATSQPERFLVTFNIDGRKAKFELTTNSVQNPFRLLELEQFICPDKL
jgi:type VI secretion system protein ImpL